MIAGLDPHIGRIDRLVVVLDAPGDPLLPRLLPFCRLHQVKLSIVPPAHRERGRAPARRRPPGARVQHVGRFAVDAAPEAPDRRRSVGGRARRPLAAAAADRRARAHRQRAPRPVPASACGSRRTPVSMLKFRTMVPDAEDLLADLLSIHELEEPVFKLRRRPARHLSAAAPPDEPRRAAAAGQRPARRDEPRRSAAGAGRARRAATARAAVPARGEAGNDGADAGLRSRRRSTSTSGSRSSATTSRTSPSAVTSASSR